MAVLIDPCPRFATPEHGERIRVDAHSSSNCRRVIRVGLLNNMPDSALESTESQFIGLLQRAAPPESSVLLRLASLPELDRGRAAREHMQRSYWSLDELLSEPLDGLIVTGTEPRASQLSDEPYWGSLRRALDWADSNTVSAVWSCLAAHAAVLYLDNIPRRRLPEKCCGVFEHRVAANHLLTRELPQPTYTPHSRWNELPRDLLVAAGYEIISESNECGVNLFTRQRNSLFLFVQGHPEYEPSTLLKEYRRDVGRFLKGEHSHYPAQPRTYLSEQARTLLIQFQRAAVADRRPETLAAFPYAACAAQVSNEWGTDAARLYQNWLGIIAAMQQ